MESAFVLRHPFLVNAVSLIVATVIWLGGVHLCFREPLGVFHSPEMIPPKARAMAHRHLQLWKNAQAREREIGAMRRSNAEWDFMGRTFLVLALCEMSLREPKLAGEHLQVVDTIIDETMRLEKENGMYFFLMPYARTKPFVTQPSRSLFIESEIALMLGARQMVSERSSYKSLLAERIDAIVERLSASPAMVMESYPDECWVFDHGVALAAIRVSDHLDGRDHGKLLTQWLEMAKQTLIDPQSGLLISSFSGRRQPMDGPEGSSIWMAVHCLRLVDEKFAREQYDLAKRELRRELCGFAWSREWPRSATRQLDIDSGLVIPVLDVSPGGSGMAFLGAASFGDGEFLRKLHTTLDFAAFPEKEGGALRYCASNQVGDSVMLYSMVLGPMWERVMKGRR